MAEEGTLERRIVTVLFADLVGFTPLSERLDAEDVAAIQDAYFAAVRETVTRYGGRLEKFIGDAAVAAFGVPRTRDDDAERATRAGAAIVNGVEQLGARLGLDPGELQVRVGIQTGEVVHAVSGPDAGRVTGDTVNTAARLQAAAPPGRVLLGEETSLAVAEIVELEVVEPIQLKGKARPVNACLVTSFRTERSRDAAMGRLRAPTIGRDAERATLGEALRRLAGRRAGTERWLIVGPPGLGKSRLLSEVLAEASASGLAAHRARVVLEPEAPFAPVADLVREALAGHPGASLEDALRAGGLGEPRRAVVADELRRLLDPTGDHLQPSTADPRDARFAAWLDGLDALAPGPIVWAVEDVHWAAADLLAFVHAAERHGGAPRLMVLATRPSLLERDASFAEASADGAASVHQLVLQPLPAADAATLVASLVGDALPPALVDRIAARADGNPLFIEELLRGWVSTGTLVAHDDAWRLATSPDEISLPATVQAIYAAQLDDLPDVPRRAARRASVSGRRVPLGALPALDVPDAPEAVDVLLRRDIVAATEPDPIGGDAVAFRHALLRDVGYASLARAERALLHLRLARWLEQTAGTAADIVAAAIAAHWELAVTSAPALAPEIGDGVSRADARREAAMWLERGALVARRIAAHEGAADLLHRALAMTDDDQVLDRARRLVALADAEHFQSSELARDGYAAAVDLLTPLVPSDGSDDPARIAYGDAVVRLCRVHFDRIEFDAADFATAVALGVLGPREDATRLRVDLQRSRAEEALTNDYAAQLARVTATAEAARRLGDPELIREAERARVGALHEADQARPEDWDAVAETARAAGDIAGVIGATINATQLRTLDDPTAVRASIDAIEPLVEAHRMLEEQCWLDQSRAEAGLVIGTWDDVLFWGDRVLEVGTAHAFDRVVIRTLHALVPVAERRRERAILERAAAWMEARRWALPRSFYGTVIQAGIDVCLTRSGVLVGDAPELETLRAAIAIGETGPNWLTSLETLVVRWIELGDVASAADALRVILATGTASKPMARPLFGLLELRLAEAGGAPARELVPAARAVIDGATRIPAPWWALEAWRVIERAGEASAAEEARTAIEPLEAQLGLDRSRT